MLRVIRTMNITMLSDYESSRKNNFTILRILFALTVLMGHAFPITGNGSDYISRLILPHAWIGSIAVGGFFAISGYLVTASFMNRSLPTFVTARIFRLYPAVIVYTLLAILVIGPINTHADVPIATYFQANPWNNFWNAGLWEWNYNLPYIFKRNPFAGSTNGSMWTLPVEVRCYVLVMVCGFFGAFDKRLRANCALLVLLYLSKFHFASLPLFGGTANFAEPLTFFIFGALFWVNRKFVPLSWVLALVAFASLIVGAKAGIYHHIAAPVIVYLIFMLVYRAPHVDMDRFGDISYGIYIYAWPVQQMVWTAGQSPYVNILYSACIVLPLAYLSWHFVEKPAINIRGKLGSVLTGGRLGERLTVVFKGKLRPASVRADSTVV